MGDVLAQLADAELVESDGDRWRLGPGFKTGERLTVGPGDITVMVRDRETRERLDAEAKAEIRAHGEQLELEAAEERARRDHDQGDTTDDDEVDPEVRVWRLNFDSSEDLIRYVASLPDERWAEFLKYREGK
ncbi:MAG TPA: hypothetical protein VF070_46300 [Streptosporangiaceae bacterium]